MDKRFVHLHNHTEYSLLDGAARISRLVATAKEQGAGAVAITDHGNMYGTYKFYKECKKQGVKAIIGCEVYVVDDAGVRNSREHRGHLVLLCKNNDGYINLCKINSYAWTKGFYYKPRVDYDFLAKHSDGLICLSGCLAGHVNHYLMKHMYAEAKDYAQKGKDIWGEDFYIELQDHGMDEQKQCNPGLIKIATELGIEVVATNDVHYIRADEAEMQDALMCVEMRKTVDDPDRMRFPSDQFYYKTYDEMAKNFGSVKGALENTGVIADKCDCHPFAHRNLFPVFQIPEDEPEKDNVLYFRKKIEQGLTERYGKITPPIRERYEQEFKVINDNGFADYFLIVADFMKFANDKGIAVGPGRGSGAGSIIAYALDITKLDPLKYNLLFERFLHSERVSAPDFDLDFCCNRRNEVIQYVVDKYGQDKVCQIVTFGTMAAKAAIKDIARVFSMPYADVDKITKPMQFNQQVRPPVLPYVFGLKKIKNTKDDKGFAELDAKEQERLLMDYGKETSKLRDLKMADLVKLYNEDAEIKKIIDMAVAVEGFPRNCSTHAAGVVICKEVVGDVTPLQRNGEDITTQFDMKEIEQLGMLKMDFLGLITLTDIQMTLDDVKAKLGKTVEFYGKPYDDKGVYKMISEADTDGVFQLESGGMKRFMKDLKPDCIEDIIAGVALYRPGPMDMIGDYCRSKHNPALAKYDHPMLVPILKNTYGAIVYQEQVMDIFKAMGGYSLGQADMVRRAMGKKDIKEMDKQRDIFIGGAAKNGVDKKTAVLIWNKMAKFAGYAFNKSHAACYAYIAYQTAYLKHYYYPYYMAAVLNNRVHKWDDMTYYILSIRNAGTKVLPPSINKSGVYFEVERGDTIRFGLGALKNVGTAVIGSILEERSNGGLFKSFGDFCRRVDNLALNKRCLESLILSGAFDELGANRKQLMMAFQGIVKDVLNQKKLTDSGQMTLFGLANVDIVKEVEIPPQEEYEEFVKLAFEKECVGIYLSGHPLQQYVDVFGGFNFDTRSLRADDEDSLAELDGRVISLGALAVDIKKVTTKATRKDMAILTVEDLFGTCEVMVFPAIYERVKAWLNKDVVVKIGGKVSVREGEAPIVLAESIEQVGAGQSAEQTSARRKDSRVSPAFTESRSSATRLCLKYNTTDEALHRDVMNVLTAYKGAVPVMVRCSASGQALSAGVSVRDCTAVVCELGNILGTENVIKD